MLIKENIPKGENKNRRPNYHEWAKAKVWTIEQAAFLLNDLDPLEYEPLILSTGMVPAELKDVLETYHELRAGYRRKMGKTLYLIEPGMVDNLTWEYNLCYPEGLMKAIYQHDYIDLPAQLANESLERIPEESSKKSTDIRPKTDFNQITRESPLMNRERRNLLKTIGLLVNMHSSKKISPR